MYFSFRLDLCYDTLRWIEFPDWSRRDVGVLLTRDTIVTQCTIFSYPLCWITFLIYLGQVFFDQFLDQSQNSKFFSTNISML